MVKQNYQLIAKLPKKAKRHSLGKPLLKKEY